MSWAAHNIVGLFTLTFEQQVSFTNCLSLGIDFLSEKMRGDLFAVSNGDLFEGLFCNSQHTARAAGTVIKQISAGLNFISDWQKQEVGHQPHGIARRPVLSSFFIILGIETAHQL